MDKGFQRLIKISFIKPFTKSFAGKVNEFPANPESDKGGEELEAVSRGKLGDILEYLFEVDRHDRVLLCLQSDLGNLKTRHPSKPRLDSLHDLGRIPACFRS